MAFTFLIRHVLTLAGGQRLVVDGTCMSGTMRAKCSVRIEGAIAGHLFIRGIGMMNPPLAPPEYTLAVDPPSFDAKELVESFDARQLVGCWLVCDESEATQDVDPSG